MLEGRNGGGGGGGVVWSNRGSLEEEGGAGEISTSSDRIVIAEAK